MGEIRRMAYRPPSTRRARVDSLTLTRLREMGDSSTLRADFHVVGLVESGVGSVMVDFDEVALTSQSVVWIPPGAVHRWVDIRSLRGDLVLFTSDAALTPITRAIVASSDRGEHWSTPADEWRLVRAALDHLLVELADEAGGSTAESPGLLLSALISRLRPPARSTASHDGLVSRFRSCVEVNFRVHRDATFYARTLGYSPRTLSRAVVRETGQTAKEYILDRVVLEAKRSLARDDMSAAQCATRLGFSDASNFSAFFHHRTGVRPSAWKHQPFGPVRTPVTPSRRVASSRMSSR